MPSEPAVCGQFTIQTHCTAQQPVRHLQLTQQMFDCGCGDVMTSSSSGGGGVDGDCGSSNSNINNNNRISNISSNSRSSSSCSGDIGMVPLYTR